MWGRQKKEPHGCGSEVFNREASNRVDRSHSNPDDWMSSLYFGKINER
jgi:hypothetical protein